jgi:hypothetical protein
MENVMRVVTYIAAVSLLAIGGCSQMGWDQSGSQSSAQGGPTAFSNGLRTNYAQPTNCSPADQTCGAGIGNPAVNSPTQKRLYPSMGNQ